MAVTQGNQTSASALNSFVGVMNSAKEKWDSSGASEAMSKMTANIPQGTQEYLSSTSQQLLNRQKFRGISVVFGVGEERPFYLEKVPTLLVARLKHNFQFFFLNYLVLTGVLFFLTMLTTPSALIGLGLLAGLWMYVVRATSEGSMTVYGVTISQKNATIGLSIFSAIASVWLLQGVFVWALFSSGFLVSIHAVLRDASMHQDGEDQMDMVGEFSGEQDAFLGQEPDV
eukprot:CAMPEP_0176169116 /NCGR_PEP_ID=MMETSP0120_2-20121206/86566_1 /TAXON_ID=160619 /ORGANISM="Kryptoperidinium foliaceum, Strain CCMP 1326" /LENGTH=227 /DNA_ID=CAMNT_0017506865 /DNA_START=27 /DNA_END=710 /DNA_ORIENTATION=-